MAYPAGDAIIQTEPTSTPRRSGHVSLACGPYNQHNYAVMTARHLKVFNKDESEPNFIRILPWGGKTCGESCMDACLGAMTWYAAVAILFALTAFGSLGNGGALSYFCMVCLCLFLIWHIATMVIIQVNACRFESSKAWYLIKEKTYDDEKIDKLNEFHVIPKSQASNITFTNVNQEQINVLRSKCRQSNVPEIQVMIYNKWYLRVLFENPFRSILFLSILHIVSIILHGAIFIHTV